MWTVGVPMSYLLSTRLGWGLTGVWLAMGLDEGIRGLMNYFRWRAGHWRELRVLSKVPPAPVVVESGV